MKIHKFGLLGIVLCLAMAGVTGCGAETGSAPSGTEQDKQTASELVVPAGEKAQGLGVFSWKLGSDGRISGMDRKGEFVSEFAASKDHAEIQSLAPNGGSKVLKADGADTFSPSARELYDAMIMDLKAAAPPASTVKDVGDNVKSTAQPVWYGPIACCSGDKAGQYYWWVNDNGTNSQYCHIDTFLQYSCSGYASCLSYAYSTGCIYQI